MIKLLTNCTYALSLIRSTKFKKYAITVKCLREKYIRLVQSLSVPHLLHFLWRYIIGCAVTHNSHSQIPHHIKWSEVAQSCPTLWDPVNCSPPGSSVHGILQARILEWVAISSSRGSSRPRDRTQVFGIAGRRFNLWATREDSHHKNHRAYVENGVRVQHSRTLSGAHFFER